jgi:hypothetical protein
MKEIGAGFKSATHVHRRNPITVNAGSISTEKLIQEVRMIRKENRDGMMPVTEWNQMKVFV